MTLKELDKLKQALKRDFNALYIPKHYKNWDDQRVMREGEIDVMYMTNIKRIIDDMIRDAKAGVVQNVTVDTNDR